MNINGTADEPEFEDIGHVAGAVRALAVEIRSQTDEIKTLVTLHRSVIKWLLIVVCVIALGNKAAELAGQFFRVDAVAQSK